MGGTADVATDPATVCIVGGGFTGLGAASILAESGFPVRLVERAPRLGGLASGFREPGWDSWLERHYHHWFRGDRWTLAFAGRWHASARIVFRPVRSAVETAQSGFAPLDSLPGLLEYPELGTLDKLRTCAALGRLMFGPDPGVYSGVSAQRWCRRHMGDASYDAIWGPLLAGKFGGTRASEIRMDWLAARLRARSRDVGISRGGMQTMVESAGQWLASRDVRIDLGTEVTAVRPADGGGWEVDADGRTDRYASVLVAASPPAMMKLVGNAASQYSKLLDQRPYMGVRTLIVALDRPLVDEDTYWYSLRPTAESPFLALVAHTTLVPASQFGNEHIVYLGAYLDSDKLRDEKSDQALLDSAVECLSRVQPKLRHTWIVRHWVHRDDYAQPVPLLGLERPPPIAVPACPGLFHASMAHITPWDRSTNWALWLGSEAAGEIQRHMSAP